MSIQDYAKKYSGKIGFIIASGTSVLNLSADQISAIRNNVAIYVNAGVMLHPKIQSPNSFFVSDDNNILNWSWAKKHFMQNRDIVSFLYKDRLEPYVASLGSNYHLYTHKVWYCPKIKMYYESGLVLTEDEPIIGTPTSAGSAVHIAHILGCDKIVLVGCDCAKSKDGKNHFWEYFPTKDQPKKKNSQMNKMAYTAKNFIYFWECLYKQSLIQNIKIETINNDVLTWYPKYS